MNNKMGQVVFDLAKNLHISPRITNTNGEIVIPGLNKFISVDKAYKLINRTIRLEIGYRSVYLATPAAPAPANTSLVLRIDEPAMNGNLMRWDIAGSINRTVSLVASPTTDTNYQAETRRDAIEFTFRNVDGKVVVYNDYAKHGSPYRLGYNWINGKELIDAGAYCLNYDDPVDFSFIGNVIGTNAYFEVVTLVATLFDHTNTLYKSPDVLKLTHTVGTVTPIAAISLGEQISDIAGGLLDFCMFIAADAIDAPVPYVEIRISQIDPTTVLNYDFYPEPIYNEESGEEYYPEPLEDGSGWHYPGHPDIPPILIPQETDPMRLPYINRFEFGTRGNRPTAICRMTYAINPENSYHDQEMIGLAISGHVNMVDNEPNFFSYLTLDNIHRSGVYQQNPPEDATKLYIYMIDGTKGEVSPRSGTVTIPDITVLLLKDDAPLLTTLQP